MVLQFGPGFRSLPTRPDSPCTRDVERVTGGLQRQCRERSPRRRPSRSRSVTHCCAHVVGGELENDAGGRERTNMRRLLDVALAAAVVDRSRSPARRQPGNTAAPVAHRVRRVTPGESKGPCDAAPQCSVSNATEMIIPATVVAPPVEASELATVDSVSRVHHQESHHQESDLLQESAQREVDPVDDDTRRVLPQVGAASGSTRGELDGGRSSRASTESTPTGCSPPYPAAVSASNSLPSLGTQIVPIVACNTGVTPPLEGFHIITVRPGEVGSPPGGEFADIQGAGSVVPLAELVTPRLTQGETPNRSPREGVECAGDGEESAADAGGGDGVAAVGGMVAIEMGVSLVTIHVSGHEDGMQMIPSDDDLHSGEPEEKRGIGLFSPSPASREHAVPSLVRGDSLIARLRKKKVLASGSQE